MLSCTCASKPAWNPKRCVTKRANSRLFHRSPRASCPGITRAQSEGDGRLGHQLIRYALFAPPETDARARSSFTFMAG